MEINYHICGIDEIHKEFKDKRYDLIVFGNILQYYKSIPALDNIISINKFLKEKWCPLLNDFGQIQLGYGFEVVAEAVKQILNGKPIMFLIIY